MTKYSADSLTWRCCNKSGRELARMLDGDEVISRGIRLPPFSSVREKKGRYVAEYEFPSLTVDPTCGGWSIAGFARWPGLYGILPISLCMSFDDVSSVVHEGLRPFGFGEYVLFRGGGRRSEILCDLIGEPGFTLMTPLPSKDARRIVGEALGALSDPTALAFDPGFDIWEEYSGIQ